MIVDVIMMNFLVIFMLVKYYFITLITVINPNYAK